MNTASEEITPECDIALHHNTAKLWHGRKNMCNVDDLTISILWVGSRDVLLSYDRIE